MLNNTLSTAISVKQLNFYIKHVLESDSNLSYIRVAGELSNFKCNYSSGHLYFTLKDSAATIKCVMFRGNATHLSFLPQDGMSVVCSGRVSVYERDGAYQLYVEKMQPEGEGDLLAAYEKLKTKLDQEGLFDASFKKPIPKFPKKVGVITSETGAAVRDIFNVLGRRYPLCDIIFHPATVQGEGAAADLCKALDNLYATDVELIIIGRGGGSTEDLWCFNDEQLARKIFQSKVPVISAVGHETDFTICDFVADLRAPTPSAAAELAVPDITELKNAVVAMVNQLHTTVSSHINLRNNALTKAKNSGILVAPERYIIEKRALLLDTANDRLNFTFDDSLSKRTVKFTETVAKLDAFSPIKTLLRGYSVAEKNGVAVKSVKQLNKGDNITLVLSDGSANCTVD